LIYVYNLAMDRKEGWVLPCFFFKKEKAIIGVLGVLFLYLVDTPSRKAS
jgi:hypothetical protein